MLDHHAPFHVAPVAPTLAPNSINVLAVMLNPVNASAAVAKVTGVKITLSG